MKQSNGFQKYWKQKNPQIFGKANSFIKNLKLGTELEILVQYSQYGHQMLRPPNELPGFESNTIKE